MRRSADCRVQLGYSGGLFVEFIVLKWSAWVPVGAFWLFVHHENRCNCWSFLFFMCYWSSHLTMIGEGVGTGAPSKCQNFVKIAIFRQDFRRWRTADKNWHVRRDCGSNVVLFENVWESLQLSFVCRRCRRCRSTVRRMSWSRGWMTWSLSWALKTTAKTSSVSAICSRNIRYEAFGSIEAVNLTLRPRLWPLRGLGQNCCLQQLLCSLSNLPLTFYDDGWMNEAGTKVLAQRLSLRPKTRLWPLWGHGQHFGL